MMSGNRSPHPTDRLIRDLIASGRAATADEVAQIVERMATAPFGQRLAPVIAELQGIRFQERIIGRREPSFISHFIRRVIIDEQWPPEATAEQYLSDLRHAIRHPEAGLALYDRRGGSIALIVAPTAAILPPERYGVRLLPVLAVLFAADRGILVSGYQVSHLGEIALPEEIRWLR